MEQQLQKRVDALNERFAEFGRTECGALKFRWQHTTEMYFFVLSDAKTLIWAPNLERKAIRYDYAMLLDPKWVVSFWKEPPPLDEWNSLGRTDFPYPANGEYYPIENIDMAPGLEPTEYETMRAVRDLRRHLAAKAQTDRGLTDGVKQLVDENKAKVDKRKRSERNLIADMIDDTMTAFGKIPGVEEGGVGLGYSRKRIVDSGGTPIEEITEKQEIIQ